MKAAEVSLAVMDRKHTHLNIVQGVINRLSQNSFLLKGWSVVLIAGLIALGTKESNPLFVYLAYFPLFAFWFLDGYFLWQERCCRKLYDKVRGLDAEEIDYSMNATEFGNSISNWLSATFSKTLTHFMVWYLPRSFSFWWCLLLAKRRKGHGPEGSFQLLVGS